MRGEPDIRSKLVFEVEDREFDEHRRDMNRYGKDSRKELGRVSQGIQHVGMMAKRWLIGTVVGAVVAVVASLGKAVTATARFRAEMAQVATLTGRSGFVGLRDQVLELSKRLPVALSDLTKGLYQAVSAGIEAGKAIKFMDVAARAAVGGAATVTQAVAGITAAINGFGKKADEAEAVADTLFVGVKRGVTTFGELSDQIGTVSGLANEANISLEETVAATAALTLTTNDTSRAVTQLRGIIQKIIKPTEQGTQALDRMGVSFDKNTIREKGFRRALLDVIEAAERTGEPLGQIFEDVEGLSGALTLANAQSESFASILGDMEGKAGASQEAFLEMKDEATNLYETLKKNLNVRLIQLGEKILPTVNRALEKTLEIMRSFDSPASNLLEVLRDLPGVDKAIIEQLEIQVARERLMAQRQAALRTLQESGTVRTNVGLADRQLLGPFMTLFNREIVNVREKTDAELNGMIDGYVAALTRLRSANLSEMEGIDRERTNQLITVIEDQIQKVQEVIRARTELKVINEQLGKTEDDLRRAMSPDSFDTGFDPMSVPPGSDIFGRGAGVDGSSPVDPEVLAKAREVLEKLTQAHELATAGSEEEKRLLGEIFALQERLADIEKAKKVLGAEAVREQEEFVRRRLDLLRQELSNAEELRRKYKEAAESFTGLVGRAGQGAVEGAGFDFQQEDPNLRDLQDKGLISEKGLRRVGMTADEAERLERALNKDLENAKDLNDAFDGIAASIRIVARSVDVFGDLSDHTRRIADGIADALDNLGKIDTGFLAGVGGAVGQALPYIGVAAGIASAVKGLIGAVNADSEARKREARERAEELRQLRDALRDNARRVSDAVERFTEAAVQGGGLTGLERDALEGRFRQFEQTFLTPDDPAAQRRASLEAQIARLEEMLANQNLPENARQAIERQLQEAIQELANLPASTLPSAADTAQAFREFLEDMKDFGVDGDLFADLFESLLAEGFSVQEAIEQIMSGAAQGMTVGLRDLLENFFSAGEVSESVAGAVEAFQRLTQLAGVEVPAAFRSMLDFMLENVEGLNDDLTALLQEAQGLDLSSAEGRARLREIVALIAANFPQFLGGLTADELQALLETMLGAADAGASGPDEFTRSVQVSRAITEIQANEVVALLDEQLFIQKEQLKALRSLVGFQIGFPPVGGIVPGNLASMVQQVRTSSMPAGTAAAMSASSSSSVNVNGVNITTEKSVDRMSDRELDHLGRLIGQKIVGQIKGKIGRHGDARL